MKTALITTTINVPSVLALYRRFDPGASVRFFVAIDTKTPRGVRQFLDNIGNCECIEATDYKCDQIIGWNSIQRRNLALLEAIKWGADIVVSVDDDNFCLDPNYFHQFTNKFFGYENISESPYLRETAAMFSGLQAGGNEWFDVGTLLQPPATHRGFPAHRAGWAEFTHVIDARIGVAAGMVLGDPDTSAVERIAKHPTVHGVSEVLRAGLVVDTPGREMMTGVTITNDGLGASLRVSKGRRGTWTVFNSQNTAFIRELAPAMMMWPGVGRYDDIFASLLCQRVMRDRGLHVHFGRPFVYQQRNSHNLVNDLASEIFGMQNIVRFAEWLDSFEFVGGESVLDNVRTVYSRMAHRVTGLDWMPPVVSECGLAWCKDIEKVMG